MKTIYQEIQAPTPRRRLTGLLPPTIALACGGAFLGAFQLLKGNKALMNWLILHVTTPYKHGISWLCGKVPFAVAEVIWALAILAALVFLVRSVWLIVRGEQKLLRLACRVLALCAAAVLVYCGYTLLWGINYYGDDFSDKSGIVTRGATTEELATLTNSFALKLNELAGAVSRDENGVFNEDLDTVFAQTGGLYDGICAEFPFLEAPERTPKRMISSPIISRLDFTGFFFPFTAESLINDDSPACLVPSTILHEIAHQRNIAGEDECNFLAILAGLRCDNTTYTYSSALLGFIHLGNALYSADPQTYWAIRGQLDGRVEADLKANSAYWDQFTGKLEQAAKQASNTVYNGFLQSYGETDGTKTYGKCVDLLVAYYFDYRTQ